MMLPENKLTPYHPSPLPQGPWLIFSPHPDDETFGMGGSLILASKQGIQTAVVILTNGFLGGNTADIVSTRKEEAKTAMDALGVKELFFWNYPDRGLVATDEAILNAAKFISEFKPNSVFFPSPLDIHPDHRQTAQIVWEALKRSGPFSGDIFSYETLTPGQVNYLVDISAVVEEKNRAMALYSSQQAVNNYSKVIQGLNCARTYTLDKHILAAEGFWKYQDTTKSLATHALDHLQSYYLSESTVKDDLVSIIVRTKNRREFLKEALQSIHAQTYTNMEIILVNDGGHDVSDIARSMKKHNINIVLVQMPTSLGRAKAANIGLDKAAGEYIAFLDDDDYIDAEHIQTLVQTIQNHREYKAVYSAVRCVNAEKEPLPIQYNGAFSLELLYHQNYIPIHAVLFSKDLLRLGCRMSEDLDCFEDWDFWLQVSTHTPFLFIDQCTANYRIHSTTEQSGATQIDIHNKLTTVHESIKNAIQAKWAKKELAEARTVSLPKDFNWEFYIANHVDLIEHGINTKSLAETHWLSYGFREQRVYNRLIKA